MWDYTFLIEIDIDALFLGALFELSYFWKIFYLTLKKTQLYFLVMS